MSFTVSMFSCVFQFNLDQSNCVEVEVKLKGKLGEKFLLAQSFYGPQTKTSLNRQFSPKSPEVGQKSSQRVQTLPEAQRTQGIESVT